VLHGLGFDAEQQLKPCAEFSGGWRMRVALAAVLFAQPDLLLLDEPTNYLDLEGTLWLENYISRYRHTAIIISHDRDLLNSTANTIVHLENRKLTSYRGNYDQFARTRAEMSALQAKMKQRQDARRKHMQAFVDRFKAKASKARQAQSRLKALQKMGETTLTVDARVQPFMFPDPAREAASPIIDMKGVSVGYQPGQPVLKNLNLRIDTDDRIALLGANGNGKSTFAKLLAARLSPQSGTLTRADKLKVGMFAQHQLDDLMPKATPVDHLRKLMPDSPESTVRGKVAQMGLDSDKMDTRAELLSGGEKARLLLGLSTFDAPNILILDEPTNHLDIDSREALVLALNGFQGAVILISHDRHLIEASAERLWLVHAGDVSPFDGDLEDYRRLILSASDGNRGGTHTATAERGPNARERRQQAAARRAEFASVKKKIDQIEARIGQARQEMGQLDADLGNPDVLRDSSRTVEISKRRREVEAAIETMEEEWLTLSTEYEEAIGA
jgi:ATP-binding cassette subfamily F protein 3